ncbi:MAG TPA: SRPBCC family protein [Candidatus Dormibacteraeota bacterium]|nr:SRPBCC family protein [Candidatus Dormibacteraeota bacterium]
MAKLHFGAGVTAKTTPERVFDYFADHRHVAEVLEGVSRWQPIGPRSRGVGARYQVEMVAFGLPLKNVLRLDRWRRPHEIGWVSESGLIKQEGGFTFKEVAGGVRIELRIVYEPPASVIGAAVARRMDGLLRRRLERALTRIRDILESPSQDTHEETEP